MKTKILILTGCLAAIILTGCNKNDDSEKKARLTFQLTDAPGEYDEVNIDLVGIEVIINDSVIELETHAGIYNLLDFVNGKDTLIADQEIPAGKLSQVRLILGNNNSLLIDGSSFDLKTPSAQQSGLKLNVHQDFVPGVAYEYIIDFDAGKSIVHTGNDKYILKPVIKVFSEAVSGAIHGIVSPAVARPIIYAISEANDTTSAFSDTLSGNFMFRGMEQGTYEIKFMPLDPYSDTSLTDVLVETGFITQLDTIQLME